MVRRWLMTGDTHGRVNERIMQMPEFIRNEDTALIILGDAGINFYLNKTDHKNKKVLNNWGMKIYCVRGNHEERPEMLDTMIVQKDRDVSGPVYVEPEFPNIRYLMDGGIYTINGLRTLVIGGAYSIDKWYRLRRALVLETEDHMTKAHRAGWFDNEQLTAEEQQSILNSVSGKDFDVVLSHTCPISWEPIHLFLSGVNQSGVDKTMENFLEQVKDSCTWRRWYFGHYHADEDIFTTDGKVKMLFQSIIAYPEAEEARQ